VVRSHIPNLLAGKRLGCNSTAQEVPSNTVCPYAFISLILYSLTIEYRDLALGHLPDFKVGGSWIPVEPNGTRLPPFWAEPTSAWEFINKKRIRI